MASPLHVSGSDAEFVWMEEAFLLKTEVKPWMELPLWDPISEGAGFSDIDCSKAFRDGLTFRSIDTTVRDTLEWANTRPADREWKAGLPAAREAEVLEMWLIRN